ncbi:MAG TPA: decarboxylating 6-phosphogluconate dehydrogenase [Usitatibacter sp.]|nr:decarboxylating 6-phosphogluconate dehydrogenase [Usitatibacter sp.]
MQLGIIGLGRMGANIARRLMRAGHECVVYDRDGGAVDVLSREGAKGAKTVEALVAQLATPRAIWIMVPFEAVDTSIASLRPFLAKGDALIDGGNSHYLEDGRRAAELSEAGIDYLDVGTSGGVWGLQEGYCLMVGGEARVFKRLEPIFATLAPGTGATPPAATPRPGTTAHLGYMHCGSVGAGHFVKMVHNGIEYGMMAAYAEGFNLMRKGDGESFGIDTREVAELWRRGTVVRSWLLDLTAAALAKDAALEGFQGVVSDSGEGRWTLHAAIEAAVPMPVLSAALFSRFASRGEDDFANRLLSAMRREFGGHIEAKPG